MKNKLRFDAIEKVFFSSVGNQIKIFTVTLFAINVLLLLVACVIGVIAIVPVLIAEPSIALGIFLFLVLSPIIFLAIWIYYLFVYAIGVVVDGCAYLPRIAQTMGVMPEVPAVATKEKKKKKKKSANKETAEAEATEISPAAVQDAETTQPSQPVAVAAVEPAAVPAHAEKPRQTWEKKELNPTENLAREILYKPNKGKPQPAIEVLDAALSYSSHEGMMEFLQGYSSVPEIAEILVLSERNARPAIRNLMNKIISDACATEATQKAEREKAEAEAQAARELEAASAQQAAMENATKTTVTEIPANLKNNRGKKVPTEEVISTALSHRSDETMIEYLREYASNPIIASILSKSERQIRPALRNVLNQLTSA